MDQRLEDRLVEWVERHGGRLAAGQLEQLALSSLPVTRSSVRRAVRGLVSLGKLAYTYQFGVSFLEKAYHGPVRLADRVVLIPPGVSYNAEEGELVVTLAGGAAFGDGRHPTTRLALSALEAIRRHRQGSLFSNAHRCLDIGTGSGILAIAALRLGVGRAMAVDIDPCARSETRQNAALNQLDHRIDVSGADVNDLKQAFDLVLANLRLPTLVALKPSLTRLIRPGGICIMSGIKQSELDRLLGHYSGEPYDCLWQRSERQRAGVVMQRK